MQVKVQKALVWCYQDIPSSPQSHTKSQGTISVALCIKLPSLVATLTVYTQDSTEAQ